MAKAWEASSNAYSAPSADYESLVRNHYSKVFAFIYCRTGDIETTRRLTGRVFKEAFERGEGTARAKPAITDLLAIAKKTAAGHGREGKGSLRLVHSADQPRQAPAPSVYGAQGATGQVDERVASLISQLGRLPQRDQDLLSLKFDAGLSYAQMAAVLRVSEADVRVSMFRALQRLRTCLNDEKQALEPA